MKRFSLLLCAVIALCGAAHAQTQQTATTNDGKRVTLNADGTWKYTEASPVVSLKIEAGLVYKSGGPQPIARTTFALLDADPLPDLAKTPPTADSRGIFDNAAEEIVMRCNHEMPDAMAIIRKYTRYTITTGFDGRAELAGVKPGKYWVFGRSETRRRAGCASWLVEVDLTKDQSLVLDQNNAAYAH